MDAKGWCDDNDDTKLHLTVFQNIGDNQNLNLGKSRYPSSWMFLKAEVVSEFDIIDDPIVLVYLNKISL